MGIYNFKRVKEIFYCRWKSVLQINKRAIYSKFCSKKSEFYDFFFEFLGFGGTWHENCYILSVTRTSFSSQLQGNPKSFRHIQNQLEVCSKNYIHEIF